MGGEGGIQTFKGSFSEVFVFYILGVSVFVYHYF